MRIFASLGAFASARRNDQGSLEKDLFPLVSQAIDRYPAQGWYDDLLREIAVRYVDVYHREGGKGQPQPPASEFVRGIRDSLDKTENPSDATPERVSTSIATAILNAATQAAADADEEFVVLEWVTMHDDAVRAAHKDVDGQQRPPGEPFIVGGEKMRYPGDPTASPGLWINCRCALAPALGSESVTAATDGGKPMVVVALPHKDDPVHSIGDEDKHLTLAYLGQDDSVDRGPIHETVKGLAEKVGEPFEAKVSGRATLGDDQANVWLCESPMIQATRDVLAAEPPVAAAMEGARDDQHPHFVPHVTIGYGEDAPPEATDVQSITFDRLALWDGDDRTEYPVGGDMTEQQTETTPPADVAANMEAVPWHGILAPEGVWSGDKRQFAENSLRFRDLPLPLTWQKQSAEGHGGSVVVARIEGIERRGNMMAGWGHFLQTPEADEAVGLVGEFGKFGVSVDADDSEFDFNEETSEITFSDARICSASMVPIPAFAEAYISLGGWPDEQAPEAAVGDEEMPAEECDPEDPDYEDCVARQKATAASLLAFVSDKPWSDFSQSDYTPEQWKSACCLHRAQETEPMSNHGLPIKEPGGALNRNGVHAAAGRFNQTSGPAEAKAKAKSALRGAYKQLGEDPPDAIKAAVELPAHFGRGPGWITNPKETKRLHDYWTRPGEPGYAKINWGVPGDFNRCRVEVGEEIAENSPDKTRFLNQICAQWHHDALGYWPGRAPSEQALEGEPAPALSMVASGGWCAPSEWFQNPEFTELTALTIGDDGRISGHLAGWSSCHVGFEDACVAPPASASGYAYFLTGEAITAEGTRVPVGNITLGGGHAARTLRPKAALAHYDSTSAVVADVNCGEDEHGIWLAGAMRPGLSDETIAAFRASAPSGDWRRVAGKMEMIAALAVNVQGFPVPRVGMHDGVQVGLVAAGAVLPRTTADMTVRLDLDVEGLAEKLEATMHARQDRRDRMAALVARVGGSD